MLSILDFDDSVISTIGSFCSKKDALNLRETSKRFAHVIACPSAYSPDQLLIIGASKGDKILCQVAKNRGATNLAGMLFQAALCNHLEICLLAKEWGACNFDTMLEGAARSGIIDLCSLAHDWGAKCYDSMLKEATWQGHTNICLLAIKWGATCFERMIEIANEGPHRAIKKIAIRQAALSRILSLCQCSEKIRTTELGTRKNSFEGIGCA